MQWLKNLLGARAPAPMAHGATRPDRPTTAAQWEFLAKFQRGAESKTVVHAGWDRVLGEPAADVVERFKVLGWLVQAPLDQKLDAACRLPELKALCAQRGLTLSGRKQALIERLVAADRDGMALWVADLDLLACAPWLLPEVVAYEEQRMRDYREMRAAAFAAVVAGDVQGAAEVVVAHARRQVFPPGLGMTWGPETVEHLVERAQAILSANPALLQAVPRDELPVFRRAAVMMELLGDATVDDWIPAGTVGHPRLAIDVVARMLLFAGRTARNVRDFKEAGITHVHVLAAAEDSCEACRRLDRRRFRLDEVPELPLAACTHPKGCRCDLVLDLYEE